MPIVEVTVNNLLKVHALLDSASGNSFCSDHLVKRLGISGKTEEYTLNTLQGSQCKTSEYVSLSLSASAEVHVMMKLLLCQRFVLLMKYQLTNAL